MPEVITISSSPPTSPVTNRLQSKANASLVFDLDDFDVTGDISFRTEQPTKRRKVSPASNGPTRAKIASKISLVDLSSEPELPAPLAVTKQSKNWRPIVDDAFADIENIVCSSSAPELRNNKGSKRANHLLDLPSDGLPDNPLQMHSDDIFVSSQPVCNPSSRTGFSLRTENILSNLSSTSSLTCDKGKGSSNGATALAELSDSKLNKTRPATRVIDDIVVSPRRKRTAKGKRAAREEESDSDDVAAKKTQREALKANRKVERDAQKEAEKDRKRRDKEEKAREKQIAADKAEVNKSKINKSDTTSDMIVEMSGSFEGTSIGTQVAEYMKNLDVEVRFVEEQVSLTSDDDQRYDFRNVVTWRRKVTALYDENDDEWYPLSKQRIEKDRHVLIYLDALEFVSMVAGYTGGEKVTAVDEGVMKDNVDLYMITARLSYGDCVPILLVQGLDAWVKKKSNEKNREYTAAVRAQAASEEVESNMPAPTSSQARARQRKKAAVPSVSLSFVTSDILDELMLHLQLNHQPIVIQRTTSPSTTASEIMKFTQHLSTRPGRIAFQEFNLKSASFCMESGQVKTGDNAQETYVKMLQEVQRVTPSMAYGIAAEYDSVRKLVEGFRQPDGNLMLENVRKSTNKDGGWSDKKLGPMVSRRLYKIFMGREPAATDGMS